MKHRFGLACVAGICLSLAAGTLSTASAKPRTQPDRWYLTEVPVPDDFEERSLSYHPNLGFKHADALFTSGLREEAVYWMYEAQVRYRIMLDCFDPEGVSTDTDIYTALSHSIQFDQNQWLGGDIQLWVDTLLAVSENYDPDQDVMIQGRGCDASVAGLQNGLEDIRNHLLQNYKELRDQRASAGMENRTSGPVIDRRLDGTSGAD